MQQCRVLLLAIILTGLATGMGCSTLSGPCGCTYNQQPKNDQQPQFVCKNQ